MKKFFAVVMLVAAMGVSAQEKSLSFFGKKAIAEVQEGKVVKSIRLKDRSQAPSSFKVGMVLSIVNSDTAEDARTFDEQVAAGDYKFIELTQLNVSKFSALSPADQAEVRRYYSPVQITDAKDTVSTLVFKFRSTR